MDKDQYRILWKEGATAWNEWRKKNPKMRTDLTGADLSGKYLAGVNLSGADLDGANFGGAILHFADLHGASLQKANLSGASLIAADLRKANLKEAVLRRADIGSADLRDADLSNAILSETDLTFAKLEGAIGIGEIKLDHLITERTDYREGLLELVKRSSQLTESIKHHIVQIESLILLAILFQILLSLQQTIQNALGLGISFLIPFTMLAITPIFVRVRNPESRLRSILTFGMSGAGFGGLLGSGIAGALHGSVAGPVGALIGAGAGLVVGGIAGPIIDGVNKKVLTQGEAREYLLKMRSKYPALRLEEILAATESPPRLHDCLIHMFSIDGIIKCTKDDVIKWLESECWK